VGLPKKPAPQQLDPSTIDVVWPGDSAVDLEKSDLFAWCVGLAKGSGKCGLDLGDEEPDVIELKKLGPRAMSRIMALAARDDPCTDDEAFRYGCVSITGRRLRFDSFGGVRGLHDSSMEAIERDIDPLELPYLAILDTMNGEEKVREETFRATLTKTLGAAVLALSFRTGR